MADLKREKLNVLVLFGGRSGEHEVSLASARSVVGRLDPAKYNVILLGIDPQGRWLLPDDSRRALDEGPADGAAAVVQMSGRARALMKLKGDILEPGGRIDVVFPVLHGPFGEDGTVQGLLELADLPYVGAGVLGSALSMDKDTMKTVLRAHGLPVPDFLALKRRDWRQDAEGCAALVRDQIGYPCFVKPANLGSSVGISKVRSESRLAAAVEEAAQYDTKIVVEHAVPQAREIECGVLGNHEPEASVVGEVIPSREFYSYEAKYLDEASELIIPAQLSGDVTEQVRAMALEAFRALDCAGMARVDFLIDAHTNEVFVSEANTIPGFTPISMFPRLWEASGIGYSELLDRLIQLALERHAERSSLRTTYRPTGDDPS